MNSTWCSQHYVLAILDGIALHAAYAMTSTRTITVLVSLCMGSDKIRGWHRKISGKMYLCGKKCKHLHSQKSNMDTTYVLSTLLYCTFVDAMHTMFDFLP